MAYINWNTAKGSCSVVISLSLFTLYLTCWFFLTSYHPACLLYSATLYPVCPADTDLQLFPGLCLCLLIWYHPPLLLLTSACFLDSVSASWSGITLFLCLANAQWSSVPQFYSSGCNKDPAQLANSGTHATLCPHSLCHHLWKCWAGGTKGAS